MKIYINKSLNNYNQRMKNYVDVIWYEDINKLDITEDKYFIFDNSFNLSKIKNKSYYSYHNIYLTEFMSFIQNEYINSDGYFKLPFQINEYDLNKYYRQSKKDNCNVHGILNNESLYDIKNILYWDSMLYITSYKDITNETRFWVVNDNIITYSSKCNQEVPLSQIKYTEKIIEQYYEPSIFYTIDIGRYNNQWKVIDYNGYSNSKFYNANIDNIISFVDRYWNNKSI